MTPFSANESARISIITWVIILSEDMISSHMKMSMISVISSFSLNLYLNSLVYHRNIFGSSSKVFGNLRQSSEIFGKFRKMFGNVRRAFGTILENLRKTSHQKRRQRYVYIIKRTLHVSSKIWILCSRGTNNIPPVLCAHSSKKNCQMFVYSGHALSYTKLVYRHATQTEGNKYFKWT